MNTNTDNQTIKNMELILQEMDKGIENKNIYSIKTLSEAYYNLLKEVMKLISSSIKLMIDEIVSIYSHKNSFEKFLGKINNELSHSIVDGKHKDAYHHTIILERFNKSLTIISDLKEAALSAKPKREYKVNPIIQDLLDLSIKSGSLVTFYNEDRRGYGKTTALIKKAAELDAVLLVGLDTQAKHARDLAYEMGVNVCIVSNRDSKLPQFRIKMKENGYLIDELVSKEMLHAQKGYKLLGGFARIVI